MFVMWVWIIADLTLLIYGLLYFYYQKYLPEFMVVLFSYGKHAKSPTTLGTLSKYLQVPKRWFIHFYVYAIVLYTFVIILLIHRFVYVFTFLDPLIEILDSILSGNHSSKHDASRVVVVTVAALMLIQSVRRGYECYFVSVFSSISRMSVGHYLAGFGFYTGVALCILSMAHDIRDDSRQSDGGWRYNALPAFQHSLQQANFSQVVSLCVFFWASSYQHKSLKILAKLRRDRNGKVCTDKYKIPRGDWFKYVSCPHFTSEIIIYLSLCLLINTFDWMWILMFVWVVIGQILAGISSHRWYKQTFGSTYPKRCAVIPYLV